MPYLVTPEQLITLSILESVPDIEKLCNAMSANMIRILFALLPVECSAQKEETHLAVDKTNADLPI